MKRVYWVVGVSSISGLLGAGAVACSSSETTTSSSEDAGTDAPADSNKAPFDAGQEEDAGPTSCPTTDTITGDDIETALGPWKGPGGVSTDCNQNDIDAIKGLFAAAGTGGTVKYTDMQSAVSANCAGCMFTPKAGGDAGRWGMYVEVDGGNFLDNRLGSCFGEAKDETCGKTRFEWQYCIRAACPLSDCVTDTAQKKCYAAASEGACKDVTTAYTTACPNEKTLIAGCTSIYQVMAATCGGGPDGGLDASN